MLTEKEFCFYADKYIDTVYRVAFSMLKNPHDADDMTQETFMKLYTSNVSEMTDEHVKNWLIKVTVNGCKNFFRARWWRHEDIDEYAQSLGFDLYFVCALLEAFLDRDLAGRLVDREVFLKTLLSLFSI